MPAVTIVAVVSGFIGFTVVSCRLKANTPATAIPLPINASAKAMIDAPGKGKEAAEKTVEAAHMATANTTTSAAGGTLSSNTCIE
jgi:hypothetical protein